MDCIRIRLFNQSALQSMSLIHPFTHTHTAMGCHASDQSARLERLRVRCLAQGHLDTPRLGTPISRHPISRHPISYISLPFVWICIV